MRARDIMSRPVVAVHTDDTIEDTADLLTRKRIAAAPVLDHTDTLVGMVSGGDLLWRRVPADSLAASWRTSRVTRPCPTVVEQVMSGMPVTGRPDVDVAEIAQLMLHYDVRSVPIVDHGRIVGIVSRRDILRTVAVPGPQPTAIARPGPVHRDHRADPAQRSPITVSNSCA